ncbi:MAG: desulfoferrodoxin [Lentisphaeria bacterium]|nr:desulfoferrodoxin [Lentisphaeria bacterium]
MQVGKRELLKCGKCGMVIEVLDAGSGVIPQHCGEEMKILVAGTTDGAKEKHVPVIEEQGEGILVKVGEVPHPMEEKHYIEWIEIDNGNYVNRYFLKPGDKPQASFYVPNQPGLVAREYCNIHGLWKK